LAFEIFPDDLRGPGTSTRSSEFTKHVETVTGDPRSDVLRLANLIVTFAFGSTRPCWLRPSRLVQNVPPGTSHPLFFVPSAASRSFACASASSSRDRPDPPEAIDRPGHYEWTRHHRPDGRFASHRAPLMRFSTPTALASTRRDVLRSSFSLRLLPRSGQPRGHRFAQPKWHRSTKRTCGVGRSIRLSHRTGCGAFLMDRDDARPAVFDRSRRTTPV
jgi:hypothetical protein